MRIWSPRDRTQLQLALESARRKPHPLVIDAEAAAESGLTVALEIMLSPLTGPSGAVDRMLGFYQPTSPVASLRGQPISSLRLKAIRATNAEDDSLLPRLRLATINGRQIA